MFVGGLSKFPEPLSCQYIFVLKISSAYYVCCMNSNALQNIFAMEANTMNPDQTVPKGAF